MKTWMTSYFSFTTLDVRRQWKISSKCHLKIVTCSFDLEIYGSLTFFFFLSFFLLQHSSPSSLYLFPNRYPSLSLIFILYFRVLCLFLKKKNQSLRVDWIKKFSDMHGYIYLPAVQSFQKVLRMLWSLHQRLHQERKDI